MVPCARLGAWIGEVAASSLVTTRPVAAGRRRSRWEDCLYPPLPRSLPPPCGLPLPWYQGVPLPWRQRCLWCRRQALPPILEVTMPRRKPSPKPADPATLTLLHTLHPHAAGIDVGATELWVCVPPGAVALLLHPPAPLPAHVRCFGAFTADLYAIAAWLRQCGVTT